MFNIVHQKQETHTTCGIACLAMCFNISQKEIVTLAESIKINVPKGISPNGLEYLINLLCDDGKSGHGYIRQVNEWLMFERLYIVSVPSLNLSGSSHWIVIYMGEAPESGRGDDFNNVRIYDPQEGIEGKLYYQYFEQVYGAFSNVFEIV